MKNLTPIIVIVICIALYFIYIGPTWTDIGVLSAQKAEYDNVLQQSKDLTEQRDAILTTYNNIPQNDIAALDEIIPDTFDGVVFANDINAIAARYGLSIKTMQFNQPNAADRSAVVTGATTQTYQTTTVTLTIDGQYQSFESFLKDVESSLRLIDVTGLAARSLGATTPGQKTPTTDTLEYTLQANTYSLQ